MKKFYFRLLIALVATFGAALVCNAQILNDHFVSEPALGQNPNAGEYRNDNGLTGVNNSAVTGGSIIGFSAANLWTGASGLPRTVSSGLTSDSVVTTGGTVQFRGANDALDRMNYRRIDSYGAGPSSLYFTGTMSAGLLDNDAVSLTAFTSFGGGDGRGVAILNNTGDFYNGLAFGFKGNGAGMDLIVRYRDGDLNYVDTTLVTGITINTSYTVMGRIDWNTGAQSNRDPFTVWVNPASQTEPGSGGTALVGFLGDPDTISSVYLLQKSFGTGTSDAIYMDEIRLGGTWADLQPIPEPSVFALVLVAFVGVLVVHRRRVAMAAV